MPNIRCAITFEAPRTRVVRPPKLIFQSGVDRFAHGADLIAFFLRGGEGRDLAGHGHRQFAPLVIAAQTVLIGAVHNRYWLLHRINQRHMVRDRNSAGWVAESPCRDSEEWAVRFASAA